MNTAAQTVIFATGDAGDHADMLTAVGPMTHETLLSVAGDRFTDVPEPSFDDDGRWVFAGAESAAPLIAKALSRAYPTLDWYCHLPTEDGEGTYDYALKAGVGFAERYVPRHPKQHKHLPEADGVLFRYAVGEQSNVLQAVYVVNDGSLTEVTDVFMQRQAIQTFATVNEASPSLDYDDDDIDMLLSQANS